jgi:hypothetical protein
MHHQVVVKSLVQQYRMLALPGYQRRAGQRNEVDKKTFQRYFRLRHLVQTRNNHQKHFHDQTGVT